MVALIRSLKSASWPRMVLFVCRASLFLTFLCVRRYSKRPFRVSIPKNLYSLASLTALSRNIKGLPCISVVVLASRCWAAFDNEDLNGFLTRHLLTYPLS